MDELDARLHGGSGSIRFARFRLREPGRAVVDVRGLTAGPIRGGGVPPVGR